MSVADPGDQARTVGRALSVAYPALIVYFRKNLPASHRNAAVDLAQDTVVSALRSLRAKADGEIDNLAAYLRKIARNVLMEFVRNKYRHRETGLEPALEIEDLKQVAADERLLDEERTRVVAEEMAHLPSDMREILVLRFGHGMSNARAAKQLRLPAAEAARLKYRALSTLRDWVDARLGSKPQGERG